MALPDGATDGDLIIAYGDGLVLSLEAHPPTDGVHGMWMWDQVAAKFLPGVPWVRHDEVPEGWELPNVPPVELQRLVLNHSAGIPVRFIPVDGGPDNPRVSGVRGSWWVDHAELVRAGEDGEPTERARTHGSRVASYRSWARKQEEVARTDADHAEEHGVSLPIYQRQREKLRGA